MRLEKTDVSQFSNINELYEYLDEHAFEIERNWDLAGIFVRYRDFTTTDEEKKLSQWEVEYFHFQFKGDRIFSLSYSTGKNIDEVQQYPCLDAFQIKAYDYLKTRSESSVNSLIRSYYFHLLWRTPKGVKNKKFGELAITNYIESIKEFYQIYLVNKETENLSKINSLFERLVQLATEIKFKQSEIRELAKFFLFETETPFYFKHSFLLDMLEHKNIFKVDSFKNTLLLIESELQNVNHKDDFLLVTTYLPTALRIAQKIGEDVKKWHNDIGLIYLRIADRETEPDRNWMKQDFLARALLAFVHAGNKEYIKKAEKLYNSLKGKVTLNKVELKLTEKQIKEMDVFHQHLKEKAKLILSYEPDGIYGILSNGFFLPRFNDIIEASKNRKNSFMDYAHKVEFDINNNIKRETKDPLFSEDMYFTYNYKIHNSLLPLLHYIFIEGVKSNKLTFKEFMTYLKEKTWIGKPVFKNNLTGELEEIEWLPLLSPSLLEYFVQIEAMTSSKFYHPNFTLCIDSLCLKMEGLFRNFCERGQIPTSVMTPKGMQEIQIHDVLENAIIKKYFNEDDRLFFNYLFSNEGGINMRNNIAHCFYGYESYTSDKMLLLIMCLLRLTKYDYSPVENITA